MRAHHLINKSWRVWLAAVLAAVTLAACGGGGGGETTGTSSVVILDSFGNNVGGDGSSGVGVGDSGADGTAGEGAAIVGGKVEVTDVNGKTVSATTDAQGYYRVKVTGFTPPFVAKVTKTDGKVLHSLNVTPLKVNGFVTVNITGLTDKIASDVAAAAGRNGAAQLTPQLVAANTGAVTTAVNNLREQLAPVISAAGLSTSNFDPLGAPFRPNLQGYDLVLENVVVTVGSDGKTQVTVSPTFVPPLSGNWSLTVTVTSTDVQGVSHTGDPVSIAAAAVPRDSATAAVWCSAGFNEAINSGGVTGTVSCSGNTLTTNYTSGGVTGVLTAVYSLTGYQGCGSCGVGSQVVVSYTLRLTDVSNSGTSVSNFVATNRFTRTN